MRRYNAESMLLTMELAKPKGALMKLTMAEAIPMIIAKTMRRVKSLEPSMTYQLTTPSMLLKSDFSIMIIGSTSENIIAKIIPCTIRAMNPRKTIIPTTKPTTQIQTRRESAYLRDGVKCTCPVSISREAIFTTLP